MLGLADRQSVFDLLEAVMAGRPAEALAITDRAYERGADFGMLLQDLLDLLHTVTRLKTVPALRDGPLLPEAERTRGTDLADRLSIPVLGRAWQMLLKGVAEVDTAPDRRAAAEMVLIRLCHVADLPSPGELVRRLGDATPPPPLAGGARGEGSQRTGDSGAAASRPPAAGNLGNLAAAPPDAISGAAPKLQNFRDVAQLVADQREAMLHAHLVHAAHLVRFAPPVIELRPAADAPRDLAARLAALLQQATGTRWTIALSAEPGEPTLAEQSRAAAAERRTAAAEHPLVRAILDAFPGARIEQVRDQTLDAYGLPQAQPEPADATAETPPADSDLDSEPDSQLNWEQRA
jgi:DNA polymerase-3 subunit gamma/tau